MRFTTIQVKCAPDFIDILVAELFEVGFDSFQEFDDGFDGSCEKEAFNQRSLESILANYEGTSYIIKEEEKINWNKEWENNYDPIIVEDNCLVRATFHEIKEHYEYEIIVNPKMSFGTGHHATTYQILAHQMNLDHGNKKVLDVGSGTGILAIMAAKRGAHKIIATDIDDWCIQNSLENFSLNSIDKIQMIKGQIDLVDDDNFDIIIANINKNVLLDQMDKYAIRLASKGNLILSGFYSSDMKDLDEKAVSLGLIKGPETVRDNWSMATFIKQ